MYQGRRHRPGIALSAVSGIVLILVLLAGLGLPGCGGGGGSKKHGGVAPGFLFINEIVANSTVNDLNSPSVLKGENGDPILDGDGSPVDWIEIFNISGKSVRLDKVTLSNDAARPTLFRLPRVKLAPSSSIVLICDGRPDLGPTHAPFDLDAAGETLGLFTKNGNTQLDEVRYVNMQADVSVGRFPDGEVDVGVIYVPTPEDFNLPIGTKLPRIDSEPGLGPVTAGSDEETALTIVVLEDDALRTATVAILEVPSCNDVDPEPVYTGEFNLNAVGELTEDLLDDRRNYLDESFQRPMQRLTLATLLPHFEPGTSLQLLFRFENVMGTVLEERCGVIVSPERPILVFDPSAWVDPRCPEPTESAEVTAFLNIAESTVAAASDITQNVSVSLSYTSGDGPEQTVDTSNGLTIEEVDPCIAECYGLDAVDNARLFRVSHEIPPQPQGTLVSFSFSAQDTLRGEASVLAPTEKTSQTSFQYASGIIPPGVVFNEVLPFSKSILEELYPEDVRNSSGFTPPNFAELYNSAEKTVSVGGMFLARSGAPECRDDGSDCPDDRIRFVREFRVPDGTRIPRKEFLAFLFVSTDQNNTAPDVSGTPLEGKTVVVENSVQLSDCVGSIFLMSRDEDGNCPVTRFDWDTRDTGSSQCPEAEDTPFGSLPDGSEEVFELDPPTPAESNCIYVSPEVVGDLNVDLGGDDCLAPDASSLSFDLGVRVAWREFDLNSDRLGIGKVEVLGNGQLLDSRTEQTRNTDDPDTPLCQVAVDLRVTLDQLFPESFEEKEITYEIRITDTRGGKGDAVARAEVVVGLCSEEGQFLRGDANFDTKRNITDLVWIAHAIFSIIKPQCPDAFDSDDNGMITTDDFFVLADFIFRRGPHLPDPFVSPGVDPTDDALQCKLSTDGS